VSTGQAIDFAATFKRWREASGVQQNDVARMANERGLSWTTATVAAIECGRRELSIGELQALRGRPIERDELAILFQRSSRPLTPAVAENLDAEIKAARKLKVSPKEIVSTSMSLWGRSLSQERDHRLDKEGVGLGYYTVDKSGQRSKVPASQIRVTANTGLGRLVQAKRGHITRALLEELRQTLRPHRGHK
jgi:transcriptional regulator with XRE-family HTH domain